MSHRNNNTNNTNTNTTINPREFNDHVTAKHLGGETTTTTTKKQYNNHKRNNNENRSSATAVIDDDLNDYSLSASLSRNPIESILTVTRKGGGDGGSTKGRDSSSSMTKSAKSAELTQPSLEKLSLTLQNTTNANKKPNTRKPQFYSSINGTSLISTDGFPALYSKNF